MSVKNIKTTTRGCFKIICSRNLVIEFTQIQNFETSKVTLLKHVLL
jgi:hypothetical protein